MSRLRLEVCDFAGPLQWRWLVSEEDTGAPLADHQVDLAGVPDEFTAFTDLYRYLRWNAVPDRRTASETEIAGRVGAWAGDVVLGRAVGEAIGAAAPGAGRVVVPERAGFISSWPLELAHAGGRPLAARGDVTLAYDLAPEQAGGARRPGGGAAGGRGFGVRGGLRPGRGGCWQCSACRRQRACWRCGGSGSSWPGWCGGSRPGSGAGWS